MNNLISIIMPVKNGEKYLKEAIDGIHNQKMNVEIILVNDCSPDNTFEVIEGLCKENNNICGINFDASRSVAEADVFKLHCDSRHRLCEFYVGDSDV